MKNLDTGTEHLIAKIENNVGYLIMNRPEARNAMSSEMNGALQEKIAEFELDEEVRCIVLTGAGNAFCAGGDVKGMNAKNEGDGEKDTIDKAIHRQRDNQRGTSGKLYKMPKPTIASLPGAAAGAGAAAEAEDKDDFTIMLVSAGDKKINVIKEVRAATSLGLKEAKDLVEGAPKEVETGVPKKEAEEIKTKLEAAGAKVELK